MPSVTATSSLQAGEESDNNLPDAADKAGWTFLTNHSHVLLCLARDPEVTLREVSIRVGITERAVQRIVADLEAGGVLQRRREGRRNRYEVDATVRLRHPIEKHRTVADLLRMIERP